VITKLIDIEKDLRHAEAVLRSGYRYINIVKDDAWFRDMELLGFLVDGHFLPFLEIIEKASKLNPDERVFALEAVGSGLSEIASELSK